MIPQKPLEALVPYMKQPETEKVMTKMVRDRAGITRGLPFYPREDVVVAGDESAHQGQRWKSTRR